MEEWRILLYPLGLLSAIAFGGRFIVQWLQSEWHQKSSVTPLFWKLSLWGNGLLALHALIQIQFHVCFFQVCNGVIAWRNLNLMKPAVERRSFKFTCALLLASFILTVLLFYLQSGYWFRIPITPWQLEKREDAAFVWHLLGGTGYFLFSSRFWMQWWLAEKSLASHLSPSFWWTSIIGASLSILYFFHINDPVNLIGPLTGLIPYLRNLMLIRKARLS
ncbi:MAG: lipid-A-disaccharide synthase N-terminal domain-containing protein [Parachlamydia sp.]|jgi:lipid-A-disaccharide synthase|nr:lipid-A-disaccharide synthase N-terminal domain-containing protein [Parachlamydia sp.]